METSAGWAPQSKSWQFGGELSWGCPLVDLCAAQAFPRLVGAFLKGLPKSSILSSTRPVKSYLQNGHSSTSTAFYWSQQSQGPPKSRGWRNGLQLLGECKVPLKRSPWNGSKDSTHVWRMCSATSNDKASSLQVGLSGFASRNSLVVSKSPSCLSHHTPLCHLDGFPEAQSGIYK